MRHHPWLAPHFKRLIANCQEKHRHHALLIQTIPGMGDEVLIYAITCFLICQQPKKQQNCGNCHNCQLMQANTHPDFYKLIPERDTNILGIDVVRKISEKLYEHARMGGAKIVWITNVTSLTESATNALLKILEEPPEQTWFFIVCYELRRLLPSVRSRCCLYKLTAPQESLALKWLKIKKLTSQEKAITALRLCNGAPKAALMLLNPNVCAQREYFQLSLKTAVKSNNWLSLLTVINNNQAPEYLYWLSSLLLDALKIQQGTTMINNVDSQMLVNTLAHHLFNKDLLTIINEICHCREQLLTTTTINRELLLTNQLLSIEYYLQ